MKRRTYAQEDIGGAVDINMSPLIDIVFLLLIFFIVTTVFVEETGVTIQKPKATSAAALDKNSLLIAVTREGKIVHAGREITLNSVRGLVARQLREKEIPVILQADARSMTGRMVEVHDECKLAGAQQIFVSTVAE